MLNSCEINEGIILQRKTSLSLSVCLSVRASLPPSLSGLIEYLILLEIQSYSSGLPTEKGIALVSFSTSKDDSRKHHPNRWPCMGVQLTSSKGFFLKSLFDGPALLS